MLSKGAGLLFVPGDSQRKLEKALASDTGALILDLEDGVAPDDKGQAREILRSAVGSLPDEIRRAKTLTLRCNAPDAPGFLEDLQLARTLAVDAVMLSKCEGARDVAAVAQVLPGMEILPLIESARGVVQIAEIVQASGNIRRVAFGAVDFALDLGVPWTPEGLERRHAMGQLVLMSRALGLRPPIGAVFPAVDDQNAFVADAQIERAMGFSGKMAIHPRQLAWLEELNASAHARLAWAARVVEAFEAAGTGSISIDGQLIDRPVYLNARRLLQTAAL